MFDTDRAGAVPHPVTIAGTAILAMLGHGASIFPLTNCLYWCSHKIHQPSLLVY